MIGQTAVSLRNIREIPGKTSGIVLPATGPGQQDVFAEAMLEKSSTHQKPNPFKWMASLGAHIAVLTILLLMPLYFSQGLNLQKLNSTKSVTHLLLEER